MAYTAIGGGTKIPSAITNIPSSVTSFPGNSGTNVPGSATVGDFLQKDLASGFLQKDTGSDFIQKGT